MGCNPYCTSFKCIVTNSTKCAAIIKEESYSKTYETISDFLKKKVNIKINVKQNEN
jgi:hypothetical protein